MNRRDFIEGMFTNLGALALGVPLVAETLRIGRTPPGSSAGIANSGAITRAPVDREISLIAEPGKLAVGRMGVFERWLYNGKFPGPEIRAKEGERLRITVRNRLPEPTTVHWHGVPLRNSMDGVPDITQPPIQSGQDFVYEFEATPAGSYMYHTHFGLQFDRGLIGPLIVEEKKPNLAYDREYTLMVTDFLPGEPKPLTASAGRGPMGGMMAMMGMQVPPYTALLINGRSSDDPFTFEVAERERVRLRLINPSGATTYRMAIGGHSMTVTHADGRPVEPLSVDSLYIAAGERYDVLVDGKNSGVWPIVAAALEQNLPPARALLRYKDSWSSQLHADAMPEGLSRGRLLQLGDLRSIGSPPWREPSRTLDLILSGGMMTSAWTINGQAYPDAAPFDIRGGDVVLVRMVNQSMMPHPMHLHGHSFQVGNVTKDTVMVWPHMGQAAFEFVADNPGKWFFHCHNQYHMDAGMARLFRYL